MRWGGIVCLCVCVCRYGVYVYVCMIYVRDVYGVCMECGGLWKGVHGVVWGGIWCVCVLCGDMVCMSV